MAVRLRTAKRRCAPPAGGLDVVLRDCEAFALRQRAKYRADKHKHEHGATADGTAKGRVTA